MPDYKIYTLEADGNLAQPPMVLGFENDQEALNHAKRQLDGHNLQVWRGSRLVTALKSPETPSTPELLKPSAWPQGLRFPPKILGAMADAFAKIIAIRGESSRQTIIDWIVELAKSGETDANRITKLILDSNPT